MAGGKKNYKVSDQIESLSEIFRHVLHSGRELVSIREELDFINNYMFLQRSKYGDRIQLKISVDEELWDCVIPKLVLQPLVENAVLHGLEPKLEGGTIRIALRRHPLGLCATVEDDGAGADCEAIRAMMRQGDGSSGAFALRNINERIQVKYGKSYGLDFYSEVGKGTTVKVCMPLLREYAPQGEPENTLPE